MEVFYYFKFPEELTRHIVDNWLAPYGRLIIGIDHYTGNPDSHSWPEDLNVHMTLKDIHEWVQLFRNAGLSNCTSSKVNISITISWALRMFKGRNIIGHRKANANKYFLNLLEYT